MAKIIVLIILLLIIVSLGSALFYLLRGGDNNKMARALTWRIALSVGLFLLLILFYWLGWIEPHGLQPG